jgi:hypothetical protein
VDVEFRDRVQFRDDLFLDECERPGHYSSFVRIGMNIEIILDFLPGELLWRLAAGK